MSLFEVLGDLKDGKALSREQATFLVETLLLPVVILRNVRIEGKTYPWGYPWRQLHDGEPDANWKHSGVADLWRMLVGRRNWHKRWLNAEALGAGDERESVFAKSMWIYLSKYVRLEIAEQLRMRKSIDKVTDSLDETNENGLPVHGEPAVEEEARETADVATLASLWLDLLVASGEPRLVRAPDPRSLDLHHAPMGLLFAEWMVFMGLPIRHELAPPQLHEFRVWTQEAWSRCHGLAKSAGGERWTRHLQPLWLDFCRAEQLTELMFTSDSGKHKLDRNAWTKHRLRLWFMREFYAWKPEFVDAGAFFTQ